MISGKNFADRCKWVYDVRYPHRQTFQYNLANDGDWVFVNGDYLNQLLQVLAPSTKQFTFIVHNSDRSFGETQLQMLLPHANHIYAINTTTTHPKLTTIPLGFVDRQLPFLESFQRPNVARDIEVYGNFKTVTNVVKRKECIEAFRNDLRVTWKDDLSVPDYYADLCRSKFVLCPEGTGIDTHRVYESLFCGATPVVLRNSLSHLYEKLPVCIVENWSDPFVDIKSKSFHSDPYFFLQ